MRFSSVKLDSSSLSDKSKFPRNGIVTKRQIIKQTQLEQNRRDCPMEKIHRKIQEYSSFMDKSNLTSFEQLPRLTDR
ncbi:hypothetical protein AAHA92_32535 [Salvia divinorum]|uniref:Uncharacterized protein n=1 Tax=Salvia divinorum TaxID=28513 RepID=A0ABD1FL44_SALDI